MKKLYIPIIIVASIILGLAIMQIAGASTETHSTLTRLSNATYETFGSVTLDFASDVNDATVTLGRLQGYLDGVVIDSTGTDTSFKVYIKDEYDITIFSKVDCNSVTEPYRYALKTEAADANDYFGIPIDGTPKVQIADANDATLTNIAIKLYYRDWRK